MAALLAKALTWFAGFLVASFLARVLALFTVVVVSVSLVQNLLGEAAAMFGGISGDIIWFLERAGFGVALGAIGGAILLKALMGIANVVPAR